MEELYAIMRDLLEIEYNQNSLLYILQLTDHTPDREEQNETKMLANGIKYYLSVLQEDLKSAISRMDTYIISEKVRIAEHNKNNRKE